MIPKPAASQRIAQAANGISDWPPVQRRTVRLSDRPTSWAASAPVNPAGPLEVTASRLRYLSRTARSRRELLLNTLLLFEGAQPKWTRFRHAIDIGQHSRVARNRSAIHETPRPCLRSDDRRAAAWQASPPRCGLLVRHVARRLYPSARESDIGSAHRLVPVASISLAAHGWLASLPASSFASQASASSSAKCNPLA